MRRPDAAFRSAHRALCQGAASIVYTIDVAAWLRVAVRRAVFRDRRPKPLIIFGVCPLPEATASVDFPEGVTHTLQM